MTWFHPNLYRSAVFSGYISDSTPSPILKMRVDVKCGVTIQMKPVWQYFYVVLFVFHHRTKLNVEFLSYFEFDHFCE